MDRLFLDANVLFSAAYRPGTGLLRFWQLRETALLTSAYALEEARRNLDEPVQRRRLARLARAIRIVPEAPLRDLPPSILLSAKDRPIILAAVEARATHLITGDLRDFGPHLKKRVLGVLVVTPGDYLRRRQ